MSGNTACKCRPRRVMVLHYKHNHSYFARGHYQNSDYSKVKCHRCGQVWITNAKWVDQFVGKETCSW